MRQTDEAYRRVREVGHFSSICQHARDRPVGSRRFDAELYLMELLARERADRLERRIEGGQVLAFAYLGQRRIKIQQFAVGIDLDPVVAGADTVCRRCDLDL